MESILGLYLRPMAQTAKFDPRVRYGVAVTAMVYSTYLACATDFSAVIRSENYEGAISSDIPLLNALQFLLVVAGMVFALAILPGDGYRRLGGVTLASVTLFLWATFNLLRGAGVVTEPVAFWDFVLDQGFATLLAAVGGWLIARGRRPVTWLLALVCVIPPLLAIAIEDINITTGIYALVAQATVGVCGLAAVWGAAWIDKLGTRSLAATGDGVSG